MSRKLGVLAIVLGILTCSMGLKTVLSSGHGSSPVMVANGPDPFPGPPQPPPRK